MIELPEDEILSRDDRSKTAVGRIIGRSRQGRDIEAFRLGRGPLRVSLIGGCHADEPVGPRMLQLLVSYLDRLAPTAPLVAGIEWSIVPHVNPDGARRNAVWSDHPIEVRDHRGEPDRAHDPALYVLQVVRELPGDDVEFGFPRSPRDRAARPENRAVAAFMAEAAPLHLHGSFHGMGFAPGPWFLLEPEWIERTLTLRRELRRRVEEMGYPLFDMDRRGEKGFHRIDEGFSTRPDSGAMRAYFLERGDRPTAAKFRPSSMELARRLGGDPLTLVSEMPLFLLAETATPSSGPVFRAGTEGRQGLLDELRRLALDRPAEEARREMGGLGIRPMPIRDQMRLQLAFLEQALNAVSAAAP